jgi:hypothetical protein
MNNPATDTLILFSREDDLWVARKPKEADSLPYVKFNDYLEEKDASFRVVLAVDNTDEGLKGLGIDVNPDWITPHDEE